MKGANVEAVESYINGLKSKDLSSVPFAPDVSFRGPLAPEPLHGVESLVEFLSLVLPLIKDTRIIRHVVEADQVCTMWELETNYSQAVIPVLEYFQVTDGLIKEMRPYYDPRPIMPPQDSEVSGRRPGERKP